MKLEKFVRCSKHMLTKKLLPDSIYDFIPFEFIITVVSLALLVLAFIVLFTNSPADNLGGEAEGTTTTMYGFMRFFLIRFILKPIKKFLKNFILSFYFAHFHQTNTTKH